MLYHVRGTRCGQSTSVEAAVPSAVSAASKIRAIHGRLSEKFWGSFEMRKLALIALLSTSTFVMGCATKNYVRETVTPVSTKLDQVADQTNKQGTQLDTTTKETEKNTT